MRPPTTANGAAAALINTAIGLLFVHSGLAGWLWARVEREVPWRTGPTWVGVMAYLGIYWGAWLLINIALAARQRNTITRSACRALVASCVLVAIQVLMPTTWLAVALALLLLAMLTDGYIVRESLHRTITAWAWSGAGLALATLITHPYFAGLPPLFIVRLAVVMTLWDWLGERLGVSRRVVRLVPTLYWPGGCRRINDQARVAT